MKYQKWLSIGVAAIMLTAYTLPVGAAGLQSSTPEAVQTESQQEQTDKHEHSFQDKHNKHNKGKMTKEEFEAYRLRKLREMAEYFGISINGKSAEQLKQEVEAAKSANAEKWEAYKAEQKAERFERLRKEATEHGIETKGKTAGQLHEELKKIHGDKRHHRPQQEQGSKRKVEKE